MPSIIFRNGPTFPLLRALGDWPSRYVEVRIEGQVLSIVATRRHGILTVVFPKTPVVSSRSIPVRAGWNESSRPVRSLDLGTLPREERRPGFWQRVKEWLMGPRRSAV
ncbi:hypothetical protein JQX13_24550 [Archangium violaceum]|uniref:hypothetical protein n=1 Tax=Archangium violaceum TaxID=83451 RepID=UPI00193C4613|nr:hypothetical protein [Archangium violaceum]QRK12919.1 hypothetical protein JQX13_24550 [Archangium violaceum]